MALDQSALLEVLEVLEDWRPPRSMTGSGRRPRRSTRRWSRPSRARWSARCLTSARAPGPGTGCGPCRARPGIWSCGSPSCEPGRSSPSLPARELFEKFGFEYFEPFVDYQGDPNSVFVTRQL